MLPRFLLKNIGTPYTVRGRLKAKAKRLKARIVGKQTIGIGR